MNATTEIFHHIAHIIVHARMPLSAGEKATECRFRTLVCKERESVTRELLLAERLPGSWKIMLVSIYAQRSGERGEPVKVEEWRLSLEGKIDIRQHELNRLYRSLYLHLRLQPIFRLKGVMLTDLSLKFAIRKCAPGEHPSGDPLAKITTLFKQGNSEGSLALSVEYLDNLHFLQRPAAIAVSPAKSARLAAGAGTPSPSAGFSMAAAPDAMDFRLQGGSLPANSQPFSIDALLAGTHHGTKPFKERERFTPSSVPASKPVPIPGSPSLNPGPQDDQGRAESLPTLPVAPTHGTPPSAGQYFWSSRVASSRSPRPVRRQLSDDGSGPTFAPASVGSTGSGVASSLRHVVSVPATGSTPVLTPPWALPGHMRRPAADERGSLDSLVDHAPSPYTARRMAHQPAPDTSPSGRGAVAPDDSLPFALDLHDGDAPVELHDFLDQVSAPPTLRMFQRDAAQRVQTDSELQFSRNELAFLSQSLNMDDFHESLGAPGFRPIEQQ